MARHCAIVIAALLLANEARANDVWIEPTRFLTKDGNTDIDLRAGHRKRTVKLPRPQAIRAFYALGPAGRTTIGGTAGEEPAGTARGLGPGLHTVIYRSQPVWLERPAERFQRYLRSEELAGPLKARDAAGRNGQPGREVYGRYAKALVAVGDPSAPGFDRRVGLPLELVCEANPHTLLPAADHLQPLPVRLFQDGKPLAGARIHISTLEPYARVHRLRTDEQGRVRVRLPHKGRWLLSSVQMVPAQEFAPWESRWASLSFEVPESSPPPASSVYAAVIERAIKSGAIRRAIGVHPFEFSRTWYRPDGAVQRVDRFLMTYTIEVHQKQRTVRVLASVRPAQANHTITIDYVTGFDGKVRSLNSFFGGDNRVAVALTGDELVTKRAHQPDESHGHVPSVLPKVAGVFLLPILFDQGLPAQVPIRDLNPFGTVTKPMVLRRLREGEHGWKAGLVAYVTEEGRERFTTRIQVLASGARKGELQQIQTESFQLVDGQEKTASLAVSNRISQERYDQLEQEYFGK